MCADCQMALAREQNEEKRKNENTDWNTKYLRSKIGVGETEEIKRKIQ